jgi:hypothetical protein
MPRLVLAGIQVYEGDGVQRYYGREQLDSWRMWRGFITKAKGVEETELLGYIPKPIQIPNPPDKYLDLPGLFLTSDTGNHFRWNLSQRKWESAEDYYER